MTEQTDILIVGAGIAGASLAYELASHANVTLLEAEDFPGRHATGRSAAFFAETYGGPHVQPLTTASKAFFEAPHEGFTDRPLLAPRGALHVAAAEDDSSLGELAAEFRGSPVRIETLDGEETSARVPILQPGWSARSLFEPDCRDINVAALHAAYLKGAKAKGATLVTDCALLSARGVEAGWAVDASGVSWRCDLLVNAAGAWADDVASRAGVPEIGFSPLRRTVVVANIDRQIDADWPLTVDAGGGLYFKPDAGRLWISPHDEVPDRPGDAQPEEMDIAVAVDRFERTTTAKVTRVERSWAGLRTFAPDRLPVYGAEPDVSGFFWCAGQGGFGIQTAPAAARLCAGLILGKSGMIPEGIDPQRYAAARFR